MNLNVPINKKLILFDGVCNLCNASVLYVIKHDRKNRFIFTALQSDAGKQVIAEFKIDPIQTDSIILYDPKLHKVYIKSGAALRISKNLGFPLYLISLLRIVPKFMSDWVYDFIAARRYKWYGKKDICMVPSPELASKFI